MNTSRPPLQQVPRDEQQFGGPGAGCPAPHGADCHGCPQVGRGELPLLSRTGLSHPMGKLDAELGKVRVHSETLLALQVRAAEHGMSLSEFVRVVLECAVFGTDSMATIAAERVRRVGQLVVTNAPQPQEVR